MYSSPPYSFSYGEGTQYDDDMVDMSDIDESPPVYDDYNHQVELTPTRSVVSRRRPADFHPYAAASQYCPRSSSSWHHNAYQLHKHMAQGDDSTAFPGGNCAITPTSSGGHSSDELTLQKMMQMIEKISDRITNIEQKISSTSSCSSGCSSNEIKSRMPPQLSKVVALIHNSLEEEKQFKPQFGVKDEHNQKVKKRIEDEIKLSKKDNYSHILIERSVQRLYETKRRNWRETSTANSSEQERVNKQAKSRRMRSRKCRLYEHRQKVVHEGQEKEKFSELTLAYMSEESSCDEAGTGTIPVHKPEWRSEKLCKFLELLDQRADKLAKDSKKHVPDRKKRVLGSPISSDPPSDAPSWTVSKEWLKDHPAD